MSAERNCPRKKTFKSIRKTVWKTRKKIRKTIRNAFETFLAPLRPLKNISPALFNKFKSFSPPKICTKKVFFLPRGSAGVATLKNKRKTKNRMEDLGPPHLTLSPRCFFVFFVMLVLLLCWEKTSSFSREAPVQFGSVTVGKGPVQAVPVFGSGGSSAKMVFLCFSTV